MRGNVPGFINIIVPYPFMCILLLGTVTPTSWDRSHKLDMALQAFTYQVADVIVEYIYDLKTGDLIMKLIVHILRVIA